MTAEDFANLIRLARRAPLQNMDEAEAAAALLQRFAAHANAELAKQAEAQSEETE